VDGHAPAQIWQGERSSAVAAINRPQQGEQRLVLTYRQQLPIAVRPIARREIEPNHFDLTEERF
jgi:hypothetical protein